MKGDLQIMISIIKFELKKFIKDKKNIVFMILLLILSFTIIKEDKSFLKSEMEYLPIEVEQYNKKLEYYNKSLKDLQNDDFKDEKKIKDIKFYKKAIEEATEDRNIAITSLKSLKEKNYKQYYRNQIRNNEKEIENLNDPYVISNIIKRNQGIERGNNNIEKYKILLDKDIKLIDENTTNEGLNFTRRLLNEKFVLTIVVFILLISSPIFSSEVENKTYKLVYTQSLSKSKIFLGKFISILLINVTVIFTVVFINFLYMSIKNGVGDLRYPLRAFMDYKLVCIPMKSYILYELLLLFLLIIVMCAIGTLISVLSNDIGVTLFSNIFILGAMYLLTKEEYLIKFNAFNPFEYLDIDRVMYGIPWALTKMDETGHDFVTMENGVLYFTIIFLVVSLMAMLCFKKKKIKS